MHTPSVTRCKFIFMCISRSILSIYLSTYLFNAFPQILHRIRSTLQNSLVQGLSVFHSSIRRRHLSPDQLPSEDRGNMVAISTFLLQDDNLVKLTMFLHPPYCTILQSGGVWWVGIFQWSTHVLLCAPIT